MIAPLLALLFACDLDSALRAAAKSSLPSQTVKNVTAKIEYARTMDKVGSLAPTTPQDELKIARAMAKNDPAVLRAIDSATRCFDEHGDLPARLTIHVPEGVQSITVDGVFALVRFLDTITLQLGDGEHDIEVNSGSARGKTSVKLAPGEPRSITLHADTPFEDSRDRYALSPSVRTIVTADNLPKLCIGAFQTSNGFFVELTSLDHVWIEKRGKFDVTDLMKVENGDVCVSNAAALREIVGDGGPFIVDVVARRSGGQRIEAGTLVSYGRTITVRGTVPEGIQLVQPGGGLGPAVPVKDGRFEIKLPEGRTDLVGERDAQHPDFFQRVELHCDAEVKLAKEKIEIVKGGCADQGGGAWREPQLSEDEELQQLSFNYADGAIKPNTRWVTRDRSPESASEEALQNVTGEGRLQVRAYAEDGTLVFRTTTGLLMRSVGDITATTWFKIDVPLTARTIEIKGWTPETSGRFDVKDFAQP